MRLKRSIFAVTVGFVIGIASTLICRGTTEGVSIGQSILLFFAAGFMGWMFGAAICEVVFPDKSERSYPKPQPWDKDYES